MDAPARAVLAPGCRQFGSKVFETCCSPTQTGATDHTSNQSAPQTQFRPRVFENCAVLRHLNLERTEYMTPPTQTDACLNAVSWKQASSRSLCRQFLIRPAACERCQQLQIVDLSRRDIPDILGSTFAHCPQLQQPKTPSKLAKKRARSIPPVCLTARGLFPLYTARRAFAGCPDHHRRKGNTAC